MTAVVEAINLTKHYGFRRGVENVSFSVGFGEIFGCLGPNGAGKTTTIRMMLDFISPSKGTIKVFGHRVSRFSSKPRHRIGYLPGELGLYEHMTGARLLDITGSLSGGSPLRRLACEALDLPERTLSRSIKTLSKGTKQKLALVQAMQHDPDLLILDEPTTGLDPVIQQSLFKYLRELKSRGKTIFFSSHVLSEVYGVCDRVGVLMDGRFILNTSVSDFVAKASRLLWLKIPVVAGTEAATSEAEIPGCTFLRRDGDWVIYIVPPEEFGRVTEVLDVVKPQDFRFESAVEQSFLSLYRKPVVR